VPRQSIKTDTEGRLQKLGAAIRAARLERSLSQEALADAAGIDRSHMGKIERGERNVSVLNVARVSDALGVTVASLMAFAEI
jgi:transcriptional regulator with XRE-family HTH domain